MTDPNDDFLFDGSGPPDADVEKMERLLRPLGRPDETPIVAPVPVRTSRAPLIAFAALFAAAAAVFVVATLRDDPAMAPPTQAATGPKVREANATTALGVGEWIETEGAGREVLVGELGRVTLGAKSRLQVRHVSDETTRFYLERGSMEARVSADARPRFFQVDTDAARCVDLGCRYTLDVGEGGAATVRVVTGQVAFESGTREVFVPAGAVCVARKGRGPGTPRFEDARETVASAFDAYDAATADRGELARAALGAVRDRRDTLPVWHLLQDADAEVVRAAAAKLTEVAGRCEIPASATPAEVRDAWKQYLGENCW